jgi:hypothetical protein
MKKRLKAIDGTTCTRRIKWWPVRQHTLPDGDKAVDIFVVIKFNTEDEHAPSKYEVAYAGAQLGFDTKQRKVIPGGVVVAKDLFLISVFHLGARVGRIQEVAQAIADRLNDDWSNRWMPNTGTMRGILQASEKSNVRFVNEIEKAE